MTPNQKIWRNKIRKQVLSEMKLPENPTPEEYFKGEYDVMVMKALRKANKSFFDDSIEESLKVMMISEIEEEVDNRIRKIESHRKKNSSNFTPQFHGNFNVIDDFFD